MVHIASPVVHAGEGQPAILECAVHADPRANVAWYKNTLLIDNRSVTLHSCTGWSIRLYDKFC